MELLRTPDFVVIDDDYISNLVCVKIIQLTFAGCTVHSFTDPQKGLNHILENYPGNDGRSAILLLDINMPVINGWEALEKFKLFPEAVKHHTSIYMLSSSVNQQDKDKANGYDCVLGYIDKPLSLIKLKTLFPQYEACK